MAFTRFLSTTGLVLALTVAAAGPAVAADVRLAVFFPDAPFRDSLEAGGLLQTLAEHVSRKARRGVEFRYYQKEDDAERAIAAGEVDLVVADYRFLADHGSALHLVPVALLTRGGQTHYQLDLVVRTDSAYQAVRDLRGKSFAITYSGALGPRFLTRLIFGMVLDVERYFSKLVPVDGANSALAAVEYRQADAALISPTLLRNSPDRAVVRSLVRVEAPLPPLCLVEGRITDEEVTAVVEGFLALQSSPAARPLLDRLGFNGLSRERVGEVGGILATLGADRLAIGPAPLFEQGGQGVTALGPARLPVDVQVVLPSAVPSGAIQPMTVELQPRTTNKRSP